MSAVPNSYVASWKALAPLPSRCALLGFERTSDRALSS